MGFTAQPRPHPIANAVASSVGSNGAVPASAVATPTSTAGWMQTSDAATKASTSRLARNASRRAKTCQSPPAPAAAATTPAARTPAPRNRASSPPICGARRHTYSAPARPRLRTPPRATRVVTTTAGASMVISSSTE